MKIIHISHIPDTANGIFTVLMALVTEQRRLGNDVSVYNLCNGEACNDIIKYATCKELISIFNREAHDIVIFHGVFYYQIYRLTKALRKSGVPYLIEMHGSLSTQNMQKSRLKKLFARRLFLDNVVKKAKAVIYLNDNELNNSAVLKVNSNSIVVPNGCYIASNSYSVATDNLQSSVTEILFLGRIDVTHKGLDMLLPAIKKLRSSGKVNNVHFSFYGSGEDADMQWLKSELIGLEGYADFYGPVYGDAKNSVYSKSDLMVLTSRYEGFPMVILESLSHGTPCLITPDTNVTDIIKEYDCGWVAEFGIDHIAETLIYAINDIQSRKELIRGNALKAGMQYRWEHIAELSIMRYKEVLNMK